MSFEIAFAAPSRPCALLSVATSAATVELARPDSQRPVLSPLPYDLEFVLKLTGDAQLHALMANEKVQKANAKLLFADQVTRKEQRENAEEKLSESPLGRAVRNVGTVFCECIPKDGTLVNLPPNADGYVPIAGDPVLVRLHFSEPKITPPIAPVPNVSNEPVKVALTVMLKVESMTGETLFLKTFEQAHQYPNPDRVIGSKYDGVIETLVKECMAEVVKILSESDDH